MFINIVEELFQSQYQGLHLKACLRQALYYLCKRHHLLKREIIRERRIRSSNDLIYNISSVDI